MAEMLKTTAPTGMSLTKAPGLPPSMRGAPAKKTGRD